MEEEGKGNGLLLLKTMSGTLREEKTHLQSVRNLLPESKARKRKEGVIGRGLTLIRRRPTVFHRE